MIFKTLKKIYGYQNNSASACTPTFHLQMDITNTCNLRCSHCYQNKKDLKGDILYLEEWKACVKQFIKLVEQLNVKPLIIISGGEPLTSPILYDLVKFIRSSYNEISIYLLTNGTLINSSNAPFLRENDINVQISIDGPNSNVNDHFRGNGSFERALAGAEILKKYNINFSLQAVLQKTNCHLVSQFFEIAKKLDAKSMDFTRLIPNQLRFNNAKSNNAYLLNFEDLRIALETIYSVSIKQRIPTNTNQPLWCLVDSSLGSPHSAGFLGLTISPTGNIQPTSRIPCKIGSVRERKGLIRAYYDNDIMRKLREGKIDGCKECKHFQKCRGDRNISYTYYNNFFGPDEQCWYWQKNKRQGADE